MWKNGDRNAARVFAACGRLRGALQTDTLRDWRRQEFFEGLGERKRTGHLSQCRVARIAVASFIARNGQTFGRRSKSSAIEAT